MIIHEMPQRSEEWFEVKRGKFSGSNFSKLFMGKSTSGYKSLINKIAFERLYNLDSGSSYVSPSMQRGIDLEDEARKQYERLTFNRVREVGFIGKDEWTGVSPDGVLSTSKGLEIKCLEYNSLMEFLSSGYVPSDYIWQIQGSLWVTGYESWDYFVYYPKIKTKPITFYPDKNYFDQLETELEIAKQKVNEIIEKVKN